MWGEAIGTASGLGVLAESLLGFIEATHGVSPYRKPSPGNGGNLQPTYSLWQDAGYSWKQNTWNFKWCMQGPKRWWFPSTFFDFCGKNVAILRLYVSDVFDGEMFHGWGWYKLQHLVPQWKLRFGRGFWVSKRMPGDRGEVEKDQFFSETYTPTPEDERLEHNSREVWFRSFSFLNGWCVGSMLIIPGRMGVEGTRSDRYICGCLKDSGASPRLLGSPGVCSRIWIDTPICFFADSIYTYSYICIRIQLHTYT